MQRFSQKCLAQLSAVLLLAGVCAAAGTVEVKNATSLDAGPAGSHGSSETINTTDRAVPAPADCESDYDGDGGVGFSDLMQVLENWGEDKSDGTGQIGFAELLSVVTLWGSCP